MNRDGQSTATGQVELSAVRTPERMHDLLTRSSRTFALNIPLLPEPTRCEVTVAYLLFRVADTLEDSTAWARQRRIDELERFATLLRRPDPRSATELASDWKAEPPCDHEGYQELLVELPLVMEVQSSLAPACRSSGRRRRCRKSAIASAEHTYLHPVCLSYRYRRIRCPGLRARSCRAPALRICPGGRRRCWRVFGRVGPA